MAGGMKNRKGIAALEFLLVVPTLIILFFGMMSIALAINAKANLHMMVRAGMQQATSGLAESENLPDIVAAAEAAGADLGLAANVSTVELCGCLDTDSSFFTAVSCTSGVCPAPETRPHRYVRVNAEAEFPYPWNLPGLPSIWTISASAEVRTR